MEIGNSEYYDLVKALHEDWVLIGEAYTIGLPTGFFTQAQVRQITFLREVGVLEPNMRTMTAPFRKVLTEAFEEQSDKQAIISRIAVRYREWHSRYMPSSQQ
jgi:hypothetical protein